jgi:hypothetical protein
MPGDLNNPDAVAIPSAYDSRYEPGTTVFNSVPVSADQIIKSYSYSILGRRLTDRERNGLLTDMENKKLLHQNPGEEKVQNAIRSYLNNIKQNSVKKVCAKWQILMK